MKNRSITVAIVSCGLSILAMLVYAWCFLVAPSAYAPVISEVGFQRSFDPARGVVYEYEGKDIYFPRDFREPYEMFAVTNELVPRVPRDGRVWLSLSRVEDRVDGCVATNVLALYDQTSGSIQEQYRETSERGSPFVPQRCRVVRVVAMTNDEPVVVADDPDSSGGPCANYWVDAADHFFVLSQRESKLTTFRIPSEKMQREQARQAQCLLQL